MNNEKLNTLLTPKLFCVDTLMDHLEDCNHLLFRSKKSDFNPLGRSSSLFSLFCTGIGLGDPMTSPISLTVPFREASKSNVNITEIMTYLISKDIIKDEDILSSWKEHFEWHNILEEMLYSASNADFLYPACYADEIYEYSDIALIQRFTDLFLNVTDVTFFPMTISAQHSAISEMMPFIVNELIPVTSSCMNEVTEEQITSLVEKIQTYLPKLLWLYSL